jgi:hypothetical protein
MKLRYAFLIGISALFGLALIAYVYSIFFTLVKMTVLSREGIDPSPRTINLNISQLVQSPKLMKALVNAPNQQQATGGFRIYSVTMTMPEFDAMNRMLASTTEGQELTKEVPNRSPTIALRPKSVWIMEVNYKGWNYQMECQYYGIEPFL